MRALANKIRVPVERAMREARIECNLLDPVVLVGGSTRMLIIRKLVSRLLGRFPDVSIDPDETIVAGTASRSV